MWLIRSVILSIILLILLLPISAARAASPDVEFTTRNVHVGGQHFRCNVVTINLASGRIEPRLVTAAGGIGRTEDFAAMIARTHAVAAVNGSFFEAYRPIGDKDPGMTLIRSGQVIHKGTLGTVVGFTRRGVLMGRLELPIRGTVETRGGRVTAWYAYWLNRTPTSPDNITIFTPAHGAHTRVGDGASVVVSNNVVVRVVSGDAAIPPFGYVIHFRGREMQELKKFVPGAKIGYHVDIRADRNTEAWQSVSEALGAGPRLLTDGQVTVDPVSEGFQDQKILSNRGLRTAIGVTRDGRVLLVTVGGPTIRELADVMHSLGAYQAMNLDGGASSGLYVRGSMVTHPGRLLSNALMFVRR